MLEKLQEQLYDALQGKLVELVVIAVLGSFTGWLAARFERSRFKKARHNNVVVFQQVHIIVRDGVDSSPVYDMLFSDLHPSISLDKVLPSEQNVELVKKLARKCSPEKPWLKFEGQEGGFVLSMLINWICGATSGHLWPMAWATIFVICEDPHVKIAWGGSKIRVLVITPKHLELMLTDEFTQRCNLESETQRSRMHAVVRLANKWLEERDRPASSGSLNDPSAEFSVGRLKPIALRTNFLPLSTAPGAFSQA